MLRAKTGLQGCGRIGKVSSWEGGMIVRPSRGNFSKTSTRMIEKESEQLSRLIRQPIWSEGASGSSTQLLSHNHREDLIKRPGAYMIQLETSSINSVCHFSFLLPTIFQVVINSKIEIIFINTFHRFLYRTQLIFLGLLLDLI